MSNKVISAIVPVFNAEATVKRCVDSILNQTYSPIEIILVDDGSKDSSFEICKSYADEYDNVKAVSKPNSGVSDTRNTGLMSATGEYVFFVDSDDYIENTMCQEMVHGIETKVADLCMCTINTIKKGRIYIESIKEETVDGTNAIALKVFEIYKTNYINSPCNKLYKRKLITSFFNKNISLGEDLLFNLDYIEKCQRVFFIDKALYNYDFSSSSSLTSIYREDSFQLATILYKRVKEYGLKHEVSLENMKPAREVYMNMIFYAIQDLFYYTNLNHKQKINTLKEWLNCMEVVEVCHNSGKVPLQQRIAALLIYHKIYNGLSLMFAVKRILTLRKGEGHG